MSAESAAQSGWYQGIFDGDVKSSSSDREALSDSSATTYDPDLYSRIDPAKTAAVMDELSLDVFMAEVPITSNDVLIEELKWRDLHDLVFAR